MISRSSRRRAVCMIRNARISCSGSSPFKSITASDPRLVNGVVKARSYTTSVAGSATARPSFPVLATCLDRQRPGLIRQLPLLASRSKLLGQHGSLGLPGDFAREGVKKNNSAGNLERSQTRGCELPELHFRCGGASAQHYRGRHILSQRFMRDGKYRRVRHRRVPR